MNALIKKLHTYAGLLTWVNLAVYGIAGFGSALQSAPDRRGAMVVQRQLPFAAPPNATDRQVAERAVAALGMTLATPVHDFVIKHDSGGNLWLDLWDVNGPRKVTFDETAGIMHVEERRNRLWNYVDNLHATTAALKSDDWRMQGWAWYNEFAMWCLGGMILSGLYLWLSARPAHRWAQASLAAGTAVFALMWCITR